ncbi:S8 family peptidase [Paenibacillus larvae]|uniref:S8 family peptidase n=1 Tax=Paenibacillus larvae TaxID=1464 RepID=UPI001F40E0AB|nr:S8 family peptidase [Paenibacillus larvae]
MDYSHPDLRQSISRGINLVHRQALPHDDNGHGTHIAGTIAASSTHSGILGVAPKARIHPVKAFDHNGSAYVSDIIAGIDWCVQQNLDIINMSFGMKTYSKSLEQAVLNAYNSGKIIVASSGNDGKKATIDYPAQLSHVISVGAITSNNKVASFSNRSNLIDIYAPGEKIYSAWLGGKYNELSGTSMATAHVSGVIALILAIKPDLKLMAVKKLLKRSSLTGNKSRNTTVEIRRLHARRAVLAVIKKT